jgi:curved DNA-binding protein CbpA
MFSKPAKVTAIGALALGSAVAVSPAAKQTKQQIMASCNTSELRHMVARHHPDKNKDNPDAEDDFNHVQEAREKQLSRCGRNRQTPSTKPKPPSGQSKKKWRQQQRGQRRQAKEEARKQSERQEKTDRKAGQQNETPEDTTSYGDIAATAVVGATALGAAHQLLAQPNRGRRRENFKTFEDGQRFVRVHPDSGRGQLHEDGHRWRALTPPRR